MADQDPGAMLIFSVPILVYVFRITFQCTKGDYFIPGRFTTYIHVASFVCQKALVAVAANFLVLDYFRFKVFENLPFDPRSVTSFVEEEDGSDLLSFGPRI